jgi:hypothetical protein
LGHLVRDEDAPGYALQFTSASQQAIDLKPVAIGSSFTIEFYLRFRVSRTA